MRPVRLGELRELLEGAAFAAWWVEYERAATALRDARQRREELASQAALMQLRSGLARRAAGRPIEPARDRRRGAKGADAAPGASLERALLEAEQRAAARQLRQRAERLLEEAGERQARAERLSADAEAAARAGAEADRRRVALLAEARERFGCAAGDRFLYWGRADDGRAAWAVPLSDDPVGANLAVKALTVYGVGRRGVVLLEPAREGPEILAAGRERRGGRG